MIDEMIGRKFGKDLQLEVVGIKKCRGRTDQYILHCSECEKDSELYGDALFQCTKGNLKTGATPCGCSAWHIHSEAQLAILAERAAKSMNYNFIGFIENKRPKVTKKSYLKLSCNICGNTWNTTSLASLERGIGCPSCGYRAVSLSKMKPDAVMIESFTRTGKYLDGTVFTRSDKIATNGSTSYWKYICPKCSVDEYVKAGLCAGIFEASSGHLQQGKLSCRCRKAYNWTDTQREYQIQKEIEYEPHYSFVGWAEQHVNKDSKVTMHCEEHGKWDVSVHSLINNGTRCPDCSGGGFNSNLQGWLYVLKVVGRTNDFTGFGISNQPKNRFKEHTRNLKSYGYSIESYHIVDGDGRTIRKIESSIISKFPKYSQNIIGFKREATFPHLYQDVINFVKEQIDTHQNSMYDEEQTKEK